MLDMNNNKGYICRCHLGFTTWHRLKDEEAKQLPSNNGGSKILCLPRSRDFCHGLLRYAGLFLIPMCFPLFDVCNVCCFCYLHFPHQIIKLLCPLLIPDCHPRVSVNVYRFHRVSFPLRQLQWLSASFSIAQYVSIFSS